MNPPKAPPKTERRAAAELVRARAQRKKLRTRVRANEARVAALNERIQRDNRLLDAVSGTRLHRGVPVKYWETTNMDGKVTVHVESLVSQRRARVYPNARDGGGTYGLEFRDRDRESDRRRRGAWGVFGEKWLGANWKKGAAVRAALDFVALDWLDPKHGDLNQKYDGVRQR